MVISTSMADMGTVMQCNAVMHKPWELNNYERNIIIERGQESPGLLKGEAGSKETTFASVLKKPT